MEVPSLSTFARAFSFHLLLFILLSFSLRLSKVLSFQTTLVDDGKTSSFQCPTDQKSTLPQLKAGFTINSSSKINSWNHSTDYCSWEGITCDVSTRHVIELDFGGGTIDSTSWISGRIDSSLFCLSSLQRLNLSCNDFHGHQIPSGLGCLTNLTHLDLSNNKLSGIIPSWIWEIGNGSLKYLNLSHNILESLEHPLPNFSSSGLQILDLHSNMLKESPPKLHASSVFYLDYSHNQFTSIIPSYINFSAMRYLFLSNNNFSGRIPKSICKAVQLEVLDLSQNNFTGTIPKCLGKISDSIKIFNLRGNSLEGTMPHSFSRSCSLRTLNLNGNQLEGSLPRSLANCKAFEVLDIGNNIFDDTFPIWLETLPQLRVLILRSNKFHGPVVCPSNHTCWPRLQIIDLSSNVFTGNLSSKFFQSLKAARGEYESQSYSSIHILRYEFKGISGFYQDSVTLMIKGMEFNVQKILSLLYVIDFSKNGFKGEIPESIGDLKLLLALNFSHNGLTGHIPTSLANLMELESLDLSQNKLSGEIPPQLVRIPFLEVLNLSKNYLIRSIPQGKQFLTFGNESFSGNTGLCGPPLSRKCEDAITTLHPNPPNTKDAQEVDEFDWRSMWIGFGFGYGIGLGMIVWTLVLWKEGSKRYIKFIHRMFTMFSPSC